jgi:hypothetical protein
VSECNVHGTCTSRFNEAPLIALTLQCRPAIPAIPGLRCEPRAAPSCTLPTTHLYCRGARGLCYVSLHPGMAHSACGVCTTCQLLWIHCPVHGV